ncbi:MAG: hypothetical protein HFE73_04950 [Firmicutes bacterium]|nr:hypothetical protein [Bacillota bacterium]
MKRFTKLICCILMSVLVFVPMDGFAASKTNWKTIREWEGTIKTDQAKEISFYIDKGTDLRIRCYEDFDLDDDDRVIAPSYVLTLLDSFGEVYEEYEVDAEQMDVSFDIGSDDEVDYFEMELVNVPKDEYTLEITASETNFFSVSIEKAEVKKNPTYKQVRAKAKSLATKNIEYKQWTDASRLNVNKIAQSKTKEYYGGLAYTLSVLAPCIDITKNSKGAKTSLRVMGLAYIISYDYILDYSKIRFYNNEDEVRYELDAFSLYNLDTDYESNYFEVTLSSSNKPQRDKLNTLIRIFEKKNVKIKVYEPYGKYDIVKLDDTTRRNWLALFKKYRILLKMYE